MKLKSIVIFLLSGSSVAMAQTDSITQEQRRPLNLTVEARADYQRASSDGTNIKEASGFKGNIVDVVLKGHITSKFSYAYRQRLNTINKDKSFFDSTDWLNIRYQANDNIAVTAGKSIVWVGGWELEPAPIDCYALSEFCYNFSCYQWGISADFTINNGKDNFTAQVCQSPFWSMSPDTYSYNIMWHGQHGFFEPLWSINMMEYEPNKFISYIALGNRFHLGPVRIDLDLLNRASSGQTFIGRDCTIAGQVCYRPITQLNLFAKVSYDVNKSGTTADHCVYNGTEITRIGGGAEYFPLKDERIRIHGYYSYAFGKNTNPNGVLTDKYSLLNLGVTWRMKVL